MCNNKLYKIILKGGICMTKIIKRVINFALCDTISMPDLYPQTDYQKHVPKNARELSEKNWKSTGDSLRHAMDKVKDENKSKI